MTAAALRVEAPIPIELSETVRIQEIATALFRARPWRIGAECELKRSTMPHGERVIHLQEHCVEYARLREAILRAAIKFRRAGFTRWEAVDGIRRLVQRAADNAVDGDVAIEILANVTAWALDVYVERAPVVTSRTVSRAHLRG